MSERKLRRGDDPEMLQRLERSKAMTPARWRSLEQVFTLSRVLERHYKECWPAGRSKLKRVWKAVVEIRQSPTWVEMGREDAATLKGYTGKLIPEAQERCLLIDSLILAQGRRQIARDVKAGRRPASAIDSRDAALIVALNHDYIGVNTKMALRDELRRRDKVRARNVSGDEPITMNDEGGGKAERQTVGALVGLHVFYPAAPSVPSQKFARSGREAGLGLLSPEPWLPRVAEAADVSLVARPAPTRRVAT